MLKLIVNGQPIQIGAQLPAAIFHFELHYNGFPPLRVTAEQEPLIRQWLLDVLSRCTCEYIQLNDTLVRVCDLPVKD